MNKTEDFLMENIRHRWSKKNIITKIISDLISIDDYAIINHIINTVNVI